MIEPTTVSAADITPKDMPTPTAPAANAVSGAEGLPPAPSAPPPPSPDAEKDSAGVPFDPTRHIRKTNKHSGRWMPRGGRKPGTAAAPSPAPQAASFIPANEPPPPKESATEPPPPSSSAGNGATRSYDPLPDHSTDAGEVACRAVQFAAGTLFDSHEDCIPAAAEHKHMVNATAAYIRSKGWQSTAGVGLLLMFSAWILKVLQKPKPRETVRGWFKGGGIEHAKDVTPLDPNTPAKSHAAPTGSIIDLPANIPPLAKS